VGKLSFVESKDFDSLEGRLKIYEMLDKFLDKHVEIKVFFSGTGMKSFDTLKETKLKGQNNNVVFLYFENGTEIFLDLNTIESFSYYGPGSLAIVLKNGDETIMIRPKK
jgi:translation elongation factor P/translation initiation factor 5A